MSNSRPPDEAFVESVFHPSDFTEESEHAFAHALAIALRRQTNLTILHVGREGKRERWMNFPSVRGTLERWGLLEEGTPRAVIFRDLSVRVKKVSLKKRRPLAAVLEYLDEHPTDMIVLATEGREGLPRWLRPSMAERLARESRTMTLFVSGSSRGFVSRDDGHVSLRRILVPIDFHPNPRWALIVAARATGISETPPVEATLLHVGESKKTPQPEVPQSPSCSWTRLQKSGEVVDGIIQAAKERSADLIVMATAGHDGILDVLRGSVTEQVLRRAPCPVLAVPVR